MPYRTKLQSELSEIRALVEDLYDKRDRFRLPFSISQTERYGALLEEERRLMVKLASA